jgi:hypothetical protein
MLRRTKAEGVCEQSAVSGQNVWTYERENSRMKTTVDIHNLYSSPNIITAIKSRMAISGYVARIG